jgi:predicted PurR-regulated permease PerM
MREPVDRVIPWLTVAILAATILLLWPFVSWILFAIWASALAGHAHGSLTRRLGNRPRLAALFTTLALVCAVAPLLAVIALLVDDAVILIRRTLAADRMQGFLQTFADQHRNRDGSSDWIGFALSQSERAWTVGQQVAGTTARIIVGLVIAIGGLYTLLVDGERWYGWLETHAPLSRSSFRRLSAAFTETGRGMIFGVLGAGLAQAVVATALYIALGVPHALTLGLLTLVCSIIPAIGTALVWVPVSIALALSGQHTSAIVLFSSGLLVIGTTDNLLGPYLARKGHLRLPGFVVAVGMFGGMALMGARGVVVGPLVLRLLKELLMIWREQREVRTT